MPITDKNRKILWARSGNRCAICRVPLVVERTAKDSESVIGEECHIVSSAPTGPRHETSFPADAFDGLDNLILLCATHHKMIDDQVETYSTTVIRLIKKNHETWVETKLRDEPNLPPIRIRRIRKNLPSHLLRVSSGKDLLSIVSGSSAHYFDHDHDLTEEEVELVGGFLQEMRDWLDLSSDLDPIDRVRAAKSIQDLIHNLESNNFFVFAATEMQRIEGGIGAPSKFRVLHLSVLRSSNPDIQNVEPDKESSA